MKYFIADVKEDWFNRTAKLTLEHDGVQEEYECTIDTIDQIAETLGRPDDDTAEPAPFYIQGKVIDMDLIPLT